MKDIFSMIKVVCLCVGVLVSSVAHAGWFSDVLTALEPALTPVKEGALASNAQVSDVSSQDAVAALKDLLQKGSSDVVSQLGRPDGFLADQAVQIALPRELQLADAYLSKLGLDGLTQGLKVRMNRAAEQAMPEATAVFMQAIQTMTIEDAVRIVRGSDDAATQYFKDRMTPVLTEKFTPLVRQQLQSVGAVQAYDTVLAQVKKSAPMPFLDRIAPDLTPDLTAYTVQKTLAGVFYYMAQKEKAIRENPAQQTTELLKKVFSAAR